MTQIVVVRIANCEGVSERTPADEARLALSKPGKFGLPDVVLFSEVSWLDVGALAAKWGYDAVQYGERGSPEAGVAIALCTFDTLSRPALAVGSRPVLGVRMRPLVSARAYGAKWTTGHAPPPRTPVARALYLARVRATGGIVGLDSNQSPAWMRRSFVRKYRGIGVLGVLVPRRWQASEAHPVDIGSDHLAVDVRLVRHGRRATSA